MSLSDFRFCTYRLSHLGEEKMLLFSAFQALMVGLKSATVVVNHRNRPFIAWGNRSPSGFFHRHLVHWHPLGRAERASSPVSSPCQLLRACCGKAAKCGI